VTCRCPECSRRLVSADTYCRTLATLNGMVRARVKILTCPGHLDVRVMVQTATKAPLFPNGRADMDVVVLIGLLHWRVGMKRCEIKTFLRSKGIYLSGGTISNRCLDFLLLFAQLHRMRPEKLKKAFKRCGGYALHIDGTHRSGGRVTFVLQEDRHGFILDADLLPSEGEEHVAGMLSPCKERYDQPLVVVRDGAESLRTAIAKVLPEVPQQLCQPHFLRNTERTLLGEPHAELKRLLVKHHLTATLRGLRVTDAEVDRNLLGLERLIVHIVVDYLLYPVKHQSKWLSDPLPYYFQYLRIKEIVPLVSRLVMCNASRDFVCSPLMELDLRLRRVLEDPAARDAFNLMHRTIRWMDMTRLPLRISRGTHLKDAPPDGHDLEEVKTQLRIVLDRIVQEGREIGGSFERVALSLRDTFQGHWEELFVPFPTVKGKTFKFRRHNNALECVHRHTRKGIRERTGREQTRVEMEQHGDLLAILSNLWNPAYQRQVLDDVWSLSDALGQYIPDLPRLREEYRLARAGPERPVPDGERLIMVKNFLQVLESSRDDDRMLTRLMKVMGLEEATIAG